MKDKKRIEVIMGVMDGKIKVSEAGMILDRSERQVYRMLWSVCKEGIKVGRETLREMLRKASIPPKKGSTIIQNIASAEKGKRHLVCFYRLMLCTITGLRGEVLY